MGHTLTSITKRRRPHFLHSINIITRQYHQQQEKDKEEEVEDEICASNHSYWTQKIHNLCNSTTIDCALQLLDRLRLRGFVLHPATLSSIVLSLCDCNRHLEAHRRLLLFLLNDGSLLRDPHAANTILSRLLDSRQTPPHLTLTLLHRLTACNPGFAPSLVTYNRLLDRFCSVPNLSQARNLLTNMKLVGRNPNVVSYTTVMNGYVRIGKLDDARNLFDEMRQSGVSPNWLTYSVLIKGVLRKRMVEEGKHLMSKLWKTVRGDDPSVRNAAFANLVDSLCREGFFHEVFRLAEEMPQGTAVGEEFAYGQMIDSLCRAGRHHGASRVVYIMRKRGFIPSLVSYNCIVHGLSRERGCMRAYQLFKEGMEFGYSLPEPTYQVLVESLCREKDLDKAKDVAEFMLGVDGNDKTRIYNIFLSALCLVDTPSEQLNVLVSMLQKQCRPDVVTLNTVIHGFCKVGKVMEARKILNDMLKGSFCAPDVVTFTTIIKGLLDVGKAEEALDILRKTMPQCSCAPNVVTYNAVLRGLFTLNNADEAMLVFSEMSGKGVTAESTTYTVIIEGLCEVGRLEEAKKFWSDVVWPSKTHDDYVYAAILRGLCSLGKLDAASDFLYELVDCELSPGIVNYNILISGACKLGLKKEAYQIVGEMRKNGLKPDAVTWRILDKLHEKESKDGGSHDQFLETKLPVEEVTVLPEIKNQIENVIHYEDCSNEIEKVGDPLDGLIDTCLSTAEGEEDRRVEQHTVGRCVHFDRDEVKSAPKPVDREPLSRIARRDFIGDNLLTIRWVVPRRREDSRLSGDM